MSLDHVEFLVSPTSIYLLTYTRGMDIPLIHKTYLNPVTSWILGHAILLVIQRIYLQLSGFDDLRLGFLL